MSSGLITPGSSQILAFKERLVQLYNAFPQRRQVLAVQFVATHHVHIGIIWEVEEGSCIDSLLFGRREKTSLMDVKLRLPGRIRKILWLSISGTFIYVR